MRSSVAYDAGPADSIPLGQGREVRIEGRRIALFRTRGGAIYATQAWCPHRGGPLADGLIGGELLACPLHEFRFELATGSPIGNTCPALETYPVTVDARGHVVVGIEAVK
jgi:nitrite reductase (NADH) small subunit